MLLFLIAPPALSGEPLSLSARDAVFLALENDPGIKVSRLAPEISRQAEEAERAAFDPVVSAGVSGSLSREKQVPATGPDGVTKPQSLSAEASVEEYLPTGTTLSAGVSGETGRDSLSPDSDARQAAWEISATQALLQGRGLDANLASLRQSRLDTAITREEVRGVALTLAAETEAAYWDAVLAERSLAIYEASVKVARDQVEEVRERIRLGKIPETELAAALAEEAGRQEELLTARGVLAKARLALLRKILAKALPGAWDRPLALSQGPEMETPSLAPVSAFVETALQARPDLSQARLEIRRGTLSVVRTKNGLLPELDLFIRLGGTWYAASFGGAGDDRENEVSALAGLSISYPMGNRKARADHRKALLSRDRSELSLANMERLVRVEVRSAFEDVKVAAESIPATRRTRELRQKTLEVEEEKFRVGRSTSFLVSQARRDLLAGELNEAKALVGLGKSLSTLYRLDGSLLSRWGVRDDSMEEKPGYPASPSRE